MQVITEKYIQKVTCAEQVKGKILLVCELSIVTWFFNDIKVTLRAGLTILGQQKLGPQREKNLGSNCSLLENLIANNISCYFSERAPSTYR